MAKKPVLGILIPCYNEARGIIETAEKIQHLLFDLYAKDLIGKESFIVFVDDGSDDDTWQKIETLSSVKNKFKMIGIQLDRNYGPQIAIIAGYDYILNHTNADCVVSIDADLQQDEKKIEDMIEKYREGYSMVIGIREGNFRKSSKLFYKVMKFLGTPIIENHSEYRLIDRDILCTLELFQERNIFLRGIISQLTGFPTYYIKYSVKDRKHGKSRYTFKKAIEDAITAVTSFTYVPLRIISFVGFIVVLISLLMMLYAVFLKLTGQTEISGWSSLMVSIWFLGGTIMLALGIIGEYLGKIYIEVKQRPRYLIKSITNKNRKDDLD